MPEIRKTEVEFEGRVEERETIVESEGVAPWGDDARLTEVGRPVPRVAGKARVTGQALYTVDVQLPGQLVARVLRSPHPHARVTAVDAPSPESLPGVYLIWHRGQPPPITTFRGRDLFPEELAYEGAEVALVVAGDDRAAQDALETIEVSYEMLPFVTGLEAALADNAAEALSGTGGNVINPEGRTYERGDVQEGWEAAAVTVGLSFATPNASHSPLEPHAVVARWEGDRLTVWESTQGIFGVRQDVAEALGISQERVRVICDFMGGGFGAKQRAGRHTILAALASRATGRPVGLRLGRWDEQTAGGYRPASKQTIRIGAAEDGKLICIEHDAWEHMGAYGHRGYAVTGPSESLYACPHVRTSVRGVRANTDRGRAFRGPGYLEGIFALESAMDALADKLDMDPLDLRLTNYAAEDGVSGEPYTSKGLQEAYEIGARLIGWRQRGDVAAPEGPWRRGWGMASQIWGGGGGPPANAIAKVLPDGGVEVLVGVQDIGTGTRTVLSQIAAEELGLGLEAVRVVVGSTESAPYGPTSAGSQTLASAGPAVRAAVRACLRQVIRLAAQMLGEEGQGEEAFGVENGEIFMRADPEVRIPFRQVAAKMDGYTIVGDGARGPNPQGQRINTFGAHFAEVEVNIETGQIRVLRVAAVHDVGRVINPLTATNQVHGGVVQGVGLSTTERRVFDEQTGLQLTADLEGYKLPTMMDTPQIDVSFLDRPDVEANSVGAKGLGEPPIIPAPAALANAVSDAIGARMTCLPMTPRQVLAHLQNEGKGRS
jgi:xanthine dehydrogenase YagR molybdenum-binding subunit